MDSPRWLWSQFCIGVRGNLEEKDLRKTTVQDELEAAETSWLCELARPLSGCQFPKLEVRFHRALVGPRFLILALKSSVPDASWPMEGRLCTHLLWLLSSEHSGQAL